jgi:hypothetical protein
MRRGAQLPRVADPARGQQVWRPGLFGLRAAGLYRLDGLLVATAVLLAPMNYLRLNAIYITASDLASTAAFLVLLARHAVPLRFFGPATGMWLISFAAFAGGLTLGSMLRGVPAALPTILTQYGFSLLVLPMILGGRSYAQTVALTKLLILSITFVMLFGIYVMYFVDHPDMRLVAGNGRLRSLVERENECAALAAVSIALLLGLYIIGELRLVWVAVCMPILVCGLFLTGSVSGLLTTALGIALIIQLCGTFRQKVFSIVAGMVVVALLLVASEWVLPEIFRERVLAPLLEGDIDQAGTFADRYLLLIEAMTLAKQTLLIGAGADQLKQLSVFHIAVHNAFALVLVEGGLLSLLGLIGMLLTGAYLAWSAIISARAHSLAGVTVTVLILYVAIFNMFPTVYARFWFVPLILAFSLCASLLLPVEVGREPGRRSVVQLREAMP